MFNKLKEKFGNWAKKISEKKQKEPEQTKNIEAPTQIPGITGVKSVDMEKLQKIEQEIAKAKEEVKAIKKERKDKTEKKLKEKEQELEKLKKEQENAVDVEELKDVEKNKTFFKKITSKIGKIKITETEFDVYSEELETLLLENNVAFEVSEKIIQELKDKIVGQELLKKEIESEIKDAFKEIIERILIEPFDIIANIKEKNKQNEPYVILFCGVNGTGKTTSIAKISELLKKEDLTSVLAAGDTFRAAAIDQLKYHGEKLNTKVIAQEYGSDPAAVGFDAIQYAKKNKINCVLIDTAGRMHTDKNLIKEIEKISKVCKPDIKVFVGESLTGNDVIEQAKSFNWAIGIDGVILTKADIDEKGGTALSVGYVIKKPILFLGVGQNYGDVELFDKKKFIQRLGLDD